MASLVAVEIMKFEKEIEREIKTVLIEHGKRIFHLKDVDIKYKHTKA